MLCWLLLLKTMQYLLLWGLVLFVVISASTGDSVLQTATDASSSTGSIPENNRVDCHPQGEIGEADCRRLGCQFVLAQEAGAPSCFLTPQRHAYSYNGPSVEASPVSSSSGWSVVNQNKLAVPVRLSGSNYSVSGGAPVQNLIVEFERYSTRVMGFRIKDADHERYEVPPSVIKLAIPRRLNKHFYRVEYVSNATTPFAFKIIRTSTNTTLIDTTLGGMVFEDNFIQLVTRLASPNVYGFGDNRHASFRHNLNWTTTPIFSRHSDPIVREEARNYAGAHPFFMVVENDGNAHGVFLLNSNALEYKLQPSPALTLRAMGGVLEFLVCFGVTPNDVIIEYTQTIGRPEIPSYWSLGIHESALAEEADEVVEKYRTADLPLDVLHIQSRDTDREWDVTVLRESLGKTVRKLQRAGGHAVVALPPYIRVDAEDEVVRSAYQDGLWKDVFVKWPAVYANSSEIVADTFGPSSALFGYDKSQLLVAYVDFFQAAAVGWWEGWLTSLHDQIPWDGVSLQQNQPYSPQTNGQTQNSLRCPKDSLLESPAYRPSAVRVWNSSHMANLLSDQSICMIAEHKINNGTFRHYDVHNIYGHSQAVASKTAVSKISGKRGLVMSESNFAGTGTVAGVWLRTSLKESVEKAIRQSIISAFEFNLFGMTLAGGSAEIFPEDERVCAKWQVFTTFHVMAKSVLNGCLKSPTAFNSSLMTAVKKALETRFRLLPYLYTLFFHGLMEGEAIFRPLFFEYGTKMHPKNLLAVDDQFFWGSAIMFVPSLDSSPTRSVYLPEDTFYQLDSGQRVSGNASRQTLAIPADEMAIFLRAGYIVPTQPPVGALNTPTARKKDFTLLIASHQHTDGSAAANGNFFWDDGESLDTVEKKDYMSWFIYNRWQEGNSTRALLDYDVERNLIVDVMADLKFSAFVIYGYNYKCGNTSALELRLNGRSLSHTTDTYSIAITSNQVLTVNLAVPLSHSFKLEIIGLCQW